MKSLIEEERVEEARALIDTLAEDPLGDRVGLSARAYVAVADAD